MGQRYSSAWLLSETPRQQGPARMGRNLSPLVPLVRMRREWCCRRGTRHGGPPRPVWTHLPPGSPASECAPDNRRRALRRWSHTCVHSGISHSGQNAYWVRLMGEETTGPIQNGILFSPEGTLGRVPWQAGALGMSCSMK